MPIRFVVDGQSWEADTPDEAVRLKQALAGSPRKNGRGPGRPPKQRPEPTPHQAQIPGLKSKRLRGAVFLPEDEPFVNALLAAQDGLTTDEVMELLKLKPLSVPPRFTTWRLRAKKHGLNFNDLMKRKEKYVNGRVRSVYTLTPLGRESLSAT